MRVHRIGLVALTLTTVCLTAALAEEGRYTVTEEGFLRHWLILAPIPLEDNQSGADGIAKEQVKDEAGLKPREGDKVKVGDKELTWKKHKTDDYLVDFNDFLGQETEDSVAYAVCYVVADAEMKDIKLLTGSDDQLKVYLNGKKVLEVTDARAADKDQDSTVVTLKKGVNVLVCKVVNEKEGWSLCARFVDKDDKPITNLKIQGVAKGKEPLNDEGFLRHWLILAAIPLEENQSGADGLAKEQVKNEAQLHPKAGDKVKVGDKELTWKKYSTGESLIDFNAFLGEEKEDCVAYAVCYVVADTEMKDIKLLTGSDDQLKVYLNGKKVLEVTEGRGADKDQDSTVVTLKKGVNVLVCKVVNEKGDWALCARFVDKDDKPITNLRIQLAP